MENLRFAVNLILLIYIRQTIEETILSTETQQTDFDNQNTDWTTKVSDCQGRDFMSLCFATYFNLNDKSSLSWPFGTHIKGVQIFFNSINLCCVLYTDTHR